MTGNNHDVYDLVVAGGGIAGLATAELFARSGFRVALVEKNEQLCQDSSGKQHGWFHLGSLYCIGPDAVHLRTMIQNTDNLLRYYRDFPRMNLRVDPTTGMLTTGASPCPGSWFNSDDSRMIFLLDEWATKEEKRKFSDYQGITWETARLLFKARNYRFARYDWRRGDPAKFITMAAPRDSPNPADTTLGVGPDIRTKLRLFASDQGHDTVRSFDRSMNVGNIVEDLTKSLKFYGGDIFTRCDFKRYERNQGRLLVHVEDLPDKKSRVLESVKLVQATGRGLDLAMMRDEHLNLIKRRVSPLVITVPALSDVNVQVLTASQTRSLNHIHHVFEGGSYSLFGDSSSANPGDDEETENAQKELVHKINDKFRPDSTVKKRAYTCYKTEVPEGAERSYSFIAHKIDDAVYIAIPGKLTLCFSVAVDLYNQMECCDPNPCVDEQVASEDVSSTVGPLHHQALARTLLDDTQSRDRAVGQS